MGKITKRRRTKGRRLKAFPSPPLPPCLPFTGNIRLPWWQNQFLQASDFMVSPPGEKLQGDNQIREERLGCGARMGNPVIIRSVVRSGQMGRGAPGPHGDDSLIGIQKTSGCRIGKQLDNQKKNKARKIIQSIYTCTKRI